MDKPQLELIPLRQAVCSDASSELDLLIRITAPVPLIQSTRPPVNVSLVVDRSGSMAGDKIEYAKMAAKKAILKLTPEDRVSVVIFDDEVETLIPSTLVTHPGQLWEKLSGIVPGGSTALHEAWRQGGLQVSTHLNPRKLNRVILLSDGQANVGIHDPCRVAADAARLAHHGVSTSTMGFGDDYNEDLMRPMAEEGSGSYYYVEQAHEIEAAFDLEFAGLTRTFGSQVSLGVDTAGGVRVLDCLNDFGLLATGRYKLPNLINGTPLEIVVRLSVPQGGGERQICRLRLAWNSPQHNERLSTKVTLTLPCVPEDQLADCSLDERTESAIARLTAARYRDEAVRRLDRGDHDGMRQVLREARDVVMRAPQTVEMAADLADLGRLEADLQTGDFNKMRKRAGYQSHASRRGRRDST